jgi:hypothetical protein
MAEQSSRAERRHVFHDQPGPSDRFSVADTATFAMRRAGPAQRWSLRISEAKAAARGIAGGFDIAQPINELRTTTGANASGGAADLSVRGLDRMSGCLWQMEPMAIRWLPNWQVSSMGPGICWLTSAIATSPLKSREARLRT